MSAPKHAVVIVGGGPTGLMLAGELALAGVDAAIVERRSKQELPDARAGGVQARTLEVFDQRGIADRFLTEGQPAQVHSFGEGRLDISDFPSRHPYGLGLWQNQIERILAGWVEELKVPVYRGREVTGFDQDETGVTVELADEGSIRCAYLVGCDGGRSQIRKRAGIDFPGWDATTSSLIAEAEMAEEPEIGIRRDAVGTHGIGRLEYEIRDGELIFADEGPVRVMVTEAEVPAGRGEPDLDDVRAGLVSVYGTDFGIHSPTSISRFTDATRQAASYREGRVLLAGDAAHIHYPAGGHGLSIGVQDAVNLGWKLARVVNGSSQEDLLDSYQEERHPVAAQVLRMTMAQVALMRPDERTTALREAVSELVAMEEPRRRLGATLSGLGVHYDLGEGHPLLGRRVPDLDLQGDEGPTRVFELLHEAQPVLLNLSEAASSELARHADLVRVVDAHYDREWELPGIGPVDAPGAVLIRPDGYVAWVGTGSDDGLEEAIARWFGIATAAA